MMMDKLIDNYPDDANSSDSDSMGPDPYEDSVDSDPEPVDIIGDFLDPQAQQSLDCREQANPDELGDNRNESTSEERLKILEESSSLKLSQNYESSASSASSASSSSSSDAEEGFIGGKRKTMSKRKNRKTRFKKKGRKTRFKKKVRKTKSKRKKRKSKSKKKKRKSKQ